MVAAFSFWQPWLSRAIYGFCLLNAAFFAATLFLPVPDGITMMTVAATAIFRAQVWQGAGLPLVTLLALPLFPMTAYVTPVRLARLLLLVAAMASLGAFAVMLSEAERVFADAFDPAEAWRRLSASRWAGFLFATLALMATRLSRSAAVAG